MVDFQFTFLLLVKAIRMGKKWRGLKFSPGDQNVVQPPYFTNRDTEVREIQVLLASKTDVIQAPFLDGIYSGQLCGRRWSEQELIKLANI